METEARFLMHQLACIPREAMPKQHQPHFRENLPMILEGF
jgi:hypothetical protein